MTTNTQSSSMVSEFTIELEQVHDFEFRVRFDNPRHANLVLDEPAPLGADQGPNASRILAAAIGNCLSASLLFCASRAKVEIGPVRTQVRVEVARNTEGRLRIAGVDVDIDPQIPEERRQNARRCLELFEDFCLVTQSVRAGIPVHVGVRGFEMPAGS